MIFPIKLEYRYTTQPSFLAEPNKFNLIKDIEVILNELVPTVPDISSQRIRVIELNKRINHTIDFYIANSNNNHIHDLLKSFKHFIIISNKSIVNFKINIQIMIGNELTIL